MWQNKGRKTGRKKNHNAKGRTLFFYWVHTGGPRQLWFLSLVFSGLFCNVDVPKDWNRTERRGNCVFVTFCLESFILFCGIFFKMCWFVLCISYVFSGTQEDFENLDKRLCQLVGIFFSLIRNPTANHLPPYLHFTILFHQPAPLPASLRPWTSSWGPLLNIRSMVENVSLPVHGVQSLIRSLLSFR